MNDHLAWETLPQIVLLFAWAIAFFGFMGSHQGKRSEVPNWINALQGTAMFSFGMTKGLVIIADRLTQTAPDFFALAYLFLFVALFAPLWIWNPRKNSDLTWKTVTLGIFYLIPLTFIAALKFKYSPDSSTTTHYWIIPVALIAGFLLFVGIFKKAQRKNVIYGGVLLAAIVGWISAISWVATWIT